MNLLLLLSALFSALSGLGTVVRGPAAVQAVAEVSVARPALRAARRIAAERPVSALPGLAASAAPVIVTAASLVQAVPLWASRRRE